MISTAIETDRHQILKQNLEHTIFSWSKQGGLNPIHADRAKGVYVYDKDGKSIIDFSSQLMCVNLGHGDERISQAVQKQMSELSYVFPGMATDVRGRLGKKLADIAPGDLNKTFFTLGGADAIENAIKIAKMYTGRHKIVTNYRSYHGATHGAIAAGGDPRRHPVDSNVMTNVIHVENPYFYRCPWYSETPEQCAERCAENLERTLLYQNPESVAAIIMEGESGSSGCIKYPKGYMKKVREICDKYGILLVSDEVMSGFGRCGQWFAIENHDVTPDMIVMAKGLTSAYLPLGGVIVSDKIMEKFNDHPLVIGLTYSAHAASCAAALEAINIYENDGLIEQARARGTYMDQQVAKLMEKHPSIGDWRNTGLLGCIELVKNRKTKEPVTPWNAKAKDMEVTSRMMAKIRELGLFTFVRWNWIFVAPPLIISEDQIDEGLDIISQTIAIADEYYKN